MPVKKMVRTGPSPSAAELTRRLVEEWRNPESTAAQPVILEESQGANQPRHVYVIWDEWEDLSQTERSEIIMDAYEQRYGLEQSLAVTVAMGLTAEEADRMGIRYE